MDLNSGKWFEDQKARIEADYLRSAEALPRSGWNGTFEGWELARRPVLDGVSRSGSFLDVGCANGCLLRSLIQWADEKGLSLTPYGVDFSAALVAAAQQMFPEFHDHFAVANAWNWVSPRTFEYVHTELVYVPENLQARYVDRLLNQAVAKGGRLIVSHYRRRAERQASITLIDRLADFGFEIEGSSAFCDGEQSAKTQVSWIVNV